MRHLFVVVAGLVLALPASADPVVERGRGIAEMNCAGCHAISEADKSPHEEAPPFRELAQRYPLDALEEAFVEGIYTGHPDMPEFVASPEQIKALLAYMATIQAPER